MECSSFKNRLLRLREDISATQSASPAAIKALPGQAALRKI